MVRQPSVFSVLLVLTAGTALPQDASLKNSKIPGGGRIVGGQDAQVGQFPYQLSLHWYGSHICGAAIIASNLAITAAHCVEGGPPGAFRVIAGKHNRTTTGPNEQSSLVSRIVIHGNWNSSSLANDIALLHLSCNLIYNDFVRPIPLPSQGQASPENITVTGWGVTQQNGPPADILKYVELPVIADSCCQNSYPNEEVLDSMICAGLPEGGKDSCQGDSGGPLVASQSEGGFLVGLVSWGYGCALAGYPGVNTEVSHFIDWIRQNSP